MKKPLNTSIRTTLRPAYSVDGQKYPGLVKEISQVINVVVLINRYCQYALVLLTRV